MEEGREFPELSFAPKSNYCSYKRFLWLKRTCPKCVFPQKKCDVGAKRCKTRSILSDITGSCQFFRYGCHSNKMLTSFSSCIQHLSIRNVCGAAILSHLSDESRILGNSLGKSPSRTVSLHSRDQAPGEHFPNLTNLIWVMSVVGAWVGSPTLSRVNSAKPSWLAGHLHSSRPSPYKRSGSILGHRSDNPLIHDSPPECLVTLFFPEIYVFWVIFICHVGSPRSSVRFLRDAVCLMEVGYKTDSLFSSANITSEGFSICRQRWAFPTYRWDLLFCILTVEKHFI